METTSQGSDARQVLGVITVFEFTVNGDQLNEWCRAQGDNA